MSSFTNSSNRYPTQSYTNTISASRATAGPSSHAYMNTTTASSSSTGDDAPAAMIGDANFEIFEWYPAYQSCQRYFLDHAQYDGSVQAVASLINICLPHQWSQNPLMGSSTHSPSTGPGSYGSGWQRTGPGGASRSLHPSQPTSTWVSLLPYIRRLVVTGFDREGVLHGFFGDDWRKGIGPLQECERRNYLFAAKSVGWANVKSQYDMNPHETVPFMRSLQNVPIAEIEGAEKTWSQWLAYVSTLQVQYVVFMLTIDRMEDWMLGERAPEQMDADGVRRTGPENRP